MAFANMQLVLAVVALLAAVAATAGGSSYEPSLDDSYDLGADQIFYGPQVKRSCIGRGGNCDHSSTDCCAGTACRCNLWGANCRCQRKGIFTKFG